jgi:hypothetical protein
MKLNEVESKEHCRIEVSKEHCRIEVSKEHCRIEVSNWFAASEI